MYRNDWYETIPEEELEKILALQEARTEEPVKSEWMAELAATFNAADTNQDGVLSMEEWIDFLDKC